MKALLALVWLAGTAFAEGQFQVEPTRVDLSTQAPASAIVISNHGSVPLRLEAKAFRWTEDADGNQQLAQTSDVIVRPAIVEVPANGSRTLRIGTTAASAGSEASYRVFVEELPNPKTLKKGQITVLTRIGVPVFLAPKQSKQALAPVVAIDGDHAVVTVKNSGTEHVKLMKVRVTAMHDGKIHWQHETPGWYVLAGADRRFPVGLATDRCAQGDSLVGEIVDEDNHTTATPLGSCER
ncbi:MAG: fimbria/pilus periplasmic chaperone [Kofleriaceae bacterium]